MICMNADQLAEVDEVLAIPYGVAKAPAVLAAVRSGLVTSLVTHDAMARTLLAARPPPAGAAARSRVLPTGPKLTAFP